MKITSEDAHHDRMLKIDCLLNLPKHTKQHYKTETMEELGTLIVHHSIFNSGKAGTINSTKYGSLLVTEFAPSIAANEGGPMLTAKNGVGKTKTEYIRKRLREKIFQEQERV